MSIAALWQLVRDFVKVDTSSAIPSQSYSNSKPIY